MEVNGNMVRNWPRFFKQMRPVECDNNFMVLPFKFIEDYGEEIPVGVTLQLPNGREISVIYEQNEKSLTHLDELVNDFKGARGVMLVLSYRGEGNFFINIFDDGMSEIEYGDVDDIPQAPVYPQDKVGGVGWKFITFNIAAILMEGEVDIPHTFVDRFRNAIPSNITIVLQNGEVFNGVFMSNRRQILGLLPLARKRYITVWEVVMFTYSGEGQFELSVFDRMKIEKTFEIINIDSDTDTDSASEAESNSGSDNGDGGDGLVGGEVNEAAESDDEPISDVEDK